jgi:hypothetical protein
MKIVSIISPYYDYLTASLMEGLQDLGHEIISSEESNYTKKTPDRQLRRFAEKADWIIVGGNQRVRTRLVEDIDNPNKVCIDGNDQQEFNVYPHILFKMVFKRELNRMWQNSAGEPVYPLPFAAEKRYFCNETVQRTIKVAFAANMNANTMRYSVYQRLINKNDPGVFCGTTRERAYLKKKCIGMPIETPKYRNILRQTHIGVNVAGAGYDCARFWEILAAGAMLMTQELDITIPHSFTDGLNCVVFRSLDEFDAKLEGLLSAPDAVNQIAEAGYQHLLQYHTTTARAAYFLDKLHALEQGKFCQSFYTGPRKSSPANRAVLCLKKMF